MGDGVPVDSVIHPMLQGEAEVEVEVQHIYPMGVSQSPAVEVGRDHIVAHTGGFVFNLRRKRTQIQAEPTSVNNHLWVFYIHAVVLYPWHEETTVDPDSKGHGEVPYYQGFLWQNPIHLLEKLE